VRVGSNIVITGESKIVIIGESAGSNIAVIRNSILSNSAGYEHIFQMILSVNVFVGNNMKVIGFYT
jgi:hypothetical protein